MRIRGIPLKIHPSWFLVFVIFSWSAQEQVTRFSDSQLPVWFSWLIGFITSSLLFISVLLHELGHSFMAIHEGIKVSSITLFFLGGVANIEKECSTPLGTFRVAIAGPIVSLSLGIIFFISINYFSTINPIYLNLLAQVGGLNIILFLFNLLPVLPLDGGVILKSLVWNFTGSKRTGIKVAIKTGRILSLFGLFIGLFILLSGRGPLGLWLLILGWFGFISSRSQIQLLSLQKALCELKVSNACSRRYRVFEEDMPIRKLTEIRLPRNSEESIPDWALICNSGRWVGYINEQILKDIPVQKWDKYSLGEFKKPLNELPSISDKEPLWKAVLKLEDTKEGRLLVFNPAGLPTGTLDRFNIGKLVLKKIGFNMPNELLISNKNKDAYPLGIALPKVVNTMLSSDLIEND